MEAVKNQEIAEAVQKNVTERENNSPEQNPFNCSAMKGRDKQHGIKKIFNSGAQQLRCMRDLCDGLPQRGY